jgi:hypothetical protein
MILYAIGLHLGMRRIRWGAVGPAFLVMSRRMAHDPRWRSLVSYALVTGIAILVLFPAGVALVRPPGAPLRPWWGLFQWILLAVWFPCLVVLALRLLRVARAADVSR